MPARSGLACIHFAPFAATKLSARTDCQSIFAIASSRRLSGKSRPHHPRMPVCGLQSRGQSYRMDDVGGRNGGAVADIRQLRAPADRLTASKRSLGFAQLFERVEKPRARVQGRRGRVCRNIDPMRRRIQSAKRIAQGRRALRQAADLRETLQH